MEIVILFTCIAVVWYIVFIIRKHNSQSRQYNDLDELNRQRLLRQVQKKQPMGYADRNSASNNSNNHADSDLAAGMAGLAAGTYVYNHLNDNDNDITNNDNDDNDIVYNNDNDNIEDIYYIDSNEANDAYDDASNDYDYDDAVDGSFDCDD